MERQDFFGEWLRERRRVLDLTQVEMAQCVGCSASALRKIETGERRPSKQLAWLLADCLGIPANERPAFTKAARGELSAGRLWPPFHALPPEPKPLRPLSHLPLPATPLVGRVVELAALERMLCDPQCRLLTIVGLGGAGKTRLAIEAARMFGERSTDGVYFVPLDSPDSPEFATSAIAKRPDLLSDRPADLRTQLLTCLRQKASLLVLDGIECLPGADDLLTDLLQQAPGAKLLVTSRERLNLRAEWVFEVHGLPVPPEDGTVEAESHSAVALFLQSARRVKHDLVLEAEEMPFVVRICRLVEGIPLGIELAAAWVPVLSCREIAHEIEGSLDFLATSGRDVPERHRSLRAVFDHSWNLLSAEERVALRCLSVFRGTFSRPAAEQVAGVSLPLLTALVNKSLLRRDEAGRYSLHELIRQYAAACLDDNPKEERAIRAGHSRYYLTMVQEREATLHSPRQKAAIDELTTELDNLRVAWQWAAAQGQVALLQRTAWPLWLYYSMRNLFQEGEAMFLRAVESVQNLDAINAVDEAARQLAVSYLQLFPAWFALRQGRIAEVLQPLRQSLETLRRGDDPLALTNALWMLGAAHMFAGQHQQASERLHEAYAVARPSDRRWEAAICTVLIGRVEYELGDYAASHRWLNEGLARSREMGDPRIISFAISSSSQTAQALGRITGMEAGLREALQTATGAGDCFVAGLLQEQLAQVVQATGDVSQASELCEECIVVYRELGDPWSLSRALTLLGNMRHMERKEVDALRCFLESLEIASRACSYGNALDALVGIATVQANNGAHALTLQMILHIQQNPAATHQAKACAAQLQAKLQALLTPQQVKAACASAEGKSLEQIVATVVRRSG
jgi:predicted ATPase/transcriptional regulator with XRE-family HTH domain